MGERCGRERREGDMGLKGWRNREREQDHGKEGDR